MVSARKHVLRGALMSSLINDFKLKTLKILTKSEDNRPADSISRF
jgi:hypothetical protein